MLIISKILHLNDTSPTNDQDLDVHEFNFQFAIMPLFHISTIKGLLSPKHKRMKLLMGNDGFLLFYINKWTSTFQLVTWVVDKKLELEVSMAISVFPCDGLLGND